MSNLKARVARLKQANRAGAPIVVCIERGETQAQAFARLGIDHSKLHPAQLVVIIDR